LPLVEEKRRIPPDTQTARLRREKRSKGKIVTVIASLDPEGNDLPALAAHLKGCCGTGGTVKDGSIELQGDRLQAAEKALQEIGYKTKRA
jgi:translation initiation factor 1